MATAAPATGYCDGVKALHSAQLQLFRNIVWYWHSQSRYQPKFPPIDNLFLKMSTKIEYRLQKVGKKIQTAGYNGAHTVITTGS